MTWLVRSELDRARVHEARERIKRARTIGAAAIGLGLIATAPWTGWWTLLLFAGAFVNLATLERRLNRSSRPERVVAGSLLFTLGLLAVGVAGSGGPDSPVLPWLVIPSAMAATRFPPRVVVALAGLTALTMIAVTAAVDPHGLVDDPTLVMASLALLVNMTAVTIALMGAELKHRDDAVLDPLTGLLNRHALAGRAIELEQQARLTGGSVCLIACDIDSFKRVNDTWGHERGDAVLRDATYGLRKALRSFELVYRLGGEEFLIVLPGVGLAEGARIAERLRAAVEAARPGGLDLTISLGVAAASGAEVRLEPLLRAADQALYRAKRAGRNRVLAAGEPGADRAAA
jgi:diguanylate cyclase (GGDEF)-like protein